jgi:hypothetical protein
VATGFIYIFDLPRVVNQIWTSKLKHLSDVNNRFKHFGLLPFDLDLLRQRKQIFQVERSENPIIKLGSRTIRQAREEEKFILRPGLLDAAVEPTSIGIADPAKTEA